MSRAGFTLVELLVVIAIITILASMLLPGLAQMRERAWNIACINNLHQIGVAMNTYTIDSKGWYPENHEGQQGDERRRGISEVSGGGRNFYHQWWGIAWPSAVNRTPPGKYLSDYRVLWCPGLLRQDPNDVLGSTFWAGSMERSFCLQGSGRSMSGTTNGSNVRMGYRAMLGCCDPGTTNQITGQPYGAWTVINRPKARKKPLGVGADPMCWLFADYYKAAISRGGPTSGISARPRR
jgi:prepilin-type N-terminal cleavage/methylation domain-containing protein